MRTTLAMDDDVLAAARGIADQQGRSIGRVLSDVARQGLQPTAPALETRNGVPLLPRRPNAHPVTLAFVNQLRDECP